MKDKNLNRVPSNNIKYVVVSLINGNALCDAGSLEYALSELSCHEAGTVEVAEFIKKKSGIDYSVLDIH